MWEDPIVADIHRTREQLAAEHDFDIPAIFADLRTRQASLGVRLVPQPKRTVPQAEVDRERPIGPAGLTPLEAAPAP